MNTLGKSISLLQNGGAKLGFWLIVITILFLVGFFAFANVEINQLGKTLFLSAMLVFIGLAVYMFFQAKTEVDLRENGIFIQKLRKKYEILFSDIEKLDKTIRVGKSGRVIFTFYLLVIVKNDGERVTLPFKVTEEFMTKFLETYNQAV